MRSTRRPIALAGSQRRHPPGARARAKVRPDEPLQVTLRLRPRSTLPERLLQQVQCWPRERNAVLTREEFETHYGADPRDVEEIEKFAHQHRLRVEDLDIARRTVRLSGASANFGAAFGVDLRHYRHPAGSYRSHSGPVHLPAALAPIVEGVLGLDDRPQARRHLRTKRRLPRHTAPRSESHTATQIADLYHFPPGVDGRGECIALIELGGGYRPEDLHTYFQQLRLPLPSLSAVSVHDVHNRPRGRTVHYDGEVEGDIEIAGGVAPGARLAVYFAPNTDHGLFEAVTQAIHDKHHRPSILSISWGDSECTWAPRTLQLLNRALQEAALLGITVCCSSGDQGSSNGLPGGSQHVNFPASSPYVLACGGTSLLSSADGTVKEKVWNNRQGASGGGISEVFPLPDWQAAVHLPPSGNRAGRQGRGVPDVAGIADPRTGYTVYLMGQLRRGGGGTSAVAPLWAGLIARINQMLGQRVGFLNPFLYREYPRLLDLAAIREITEGTNGAYRAGGGWNPCTGLGTPDGAKLASALLAAQSPKAAMR